jgi:DNA polymerase III epsilon subunit-like protein
MAKLSAKGSSYHIAQLAAHNAEFDGAFLRAWFGRLDLYLPAHPKVLCTLQRALWYFAERPELPRPKDFKLATLCDYFGVPFHAASAHEALADVTATLRLYAALSGRGSREPGEAPRSRFAESKLLNDTQEATPR